MEVYKNKIDKLVKELDEIKCVLETSRYNVVREEKVFEKSAKKGRATLGYEAAKKSFKEEIQIHKQDIKCSNDNLEVPVQEAEWMKGNVKYLYWDNAEEWDNICRVLQNSKLNRRKKRDIQEISDCYDEVNVYYHWDKAEEWEDICFFLRSGKKRTVSTKNFWETFQVDTFSERVINLKCVYDREQRLLIPRNKLEEAINRAGAKQQRSLRRKEINEYELRNRMFIPIFALQDALKQYEYCKDNYEQIEALASEIMEWLCRNVGYNKHVGKFSVTEYSEIIYERIVYLSNETTKAEIRELITNVNHLLFRVCTYLGFDVDAIKEEYKYFLEREYVYKQELAPQIVENDYSEDYWTDIYEMFDDYSDYEEMEEL